MGNCKPFQTYTFGWLVFPQPVKASIFHCQMQVVFGVVTFYFLKFFVPACRISLEIMTLQPRCEDVETAEGVAITVTGVAQVKAPD